MNIKMKIIKIQLGLLRSILHSLLNIKKPTDKLVVFCSTKLDKMIIRYYKAIPTIDKNVN